MKQYIDKAAVVAEIEKLKLCTMDEHMNFYSEAAEGEYHALFNLESFLDTLEVIKIGVDEGDPQGDIGVKAKNELEDAAHQVCGAMDVFFDRFSKFMED